jgi:hypothetical protein
MSHAVLELQQIILANSFTPDDVKLIDVCDRRIDVWLTDVFGNKPFSAASLKLNGNDLQDVLNRPRPPLPVPHRQSPEWQGERSHAMVTLQEHLNAPDPLILRTDNGALSKVGLAQLVAIQHIQRVVAINFRRAAAKAWF